MMLAPHFSVLEFERASDRPLTATDIDHATDLAERLEVIREQLGVPLTITSFIRKDSDGQHGNGTAVDFEAVGSGYTQRQLFDQVSTLAAMGELGVFGQLIFYPFSDEHIHLSLPTGVRRNQVLIADAAEKVYSEPSPGLVASIPGSVVAGVFLFALAGLAIAVLRGRNA